VLDDIYVHVKLVPVESAVEQVFNIKLNVVAEAIVLLIV
jgi:hypothetical protein